MSAPAAVREVRSNAIDADAAVAERSGDFRFRELLSPAEWAALPLAVRHRFSKRLSDAATAVYTGHVTMCAMSRTGWLLAQALRVIGAPLPMARQIGLPAVVTVTEDHASGGQNWTRVYARASGFPQVIHSTKRFSGSTGLEEYIGHGIRMALTLSVENGTLVFTSAGYFIDCGGFCLRLPRWLTPGKTVVTHRETTGNQFLFTLELSHSLFGTLIRQEALYWEVRACSGESS
jgi:hypothetical protein